MASRYEKGTGLAPYRPDKREKWFHTFKVEIGDRARFAEQMIAGVWIFSRVF